MSKADPKLPTHLMKLSKSELESLCVDCGLCCLPQIELAKGHKVLIPDLKCRYLDVDDTGKSCCGIYEDRDTKAGSWCLPLAKAIDQGIFPKACPYVAEMDGYVGTNILPDEQYQKLKPHIQKALYPYQRPEWITSKSWAVFVNGEEYLKKSGFWDEDVADAEEEAEEDAE